MISVGRHQKQAFPSSQLQNYWNSKLPFQATDIYGFLPIFAIMLVIVIMGKIIKPICAKLYLRHFLGTLPHSRMHEFGVQVSGSLLASGQEEDSILLDCAGFDLELRLLEPLPWLEFRSLQLEIWLFE